MDLCSPTQNTKPTKELRQTPTSNSICMQQFIYKLFLVRPSIYMLHILQEKFKKFVFLASPKTQVVTVHPPYRNLVLEIKVLLGRSRGRVLPSKSKLLSCCFLIGVVVPWNLAKGIVVLLFSSITQSKFVWGVQGSLEVLSSHMAVLVQSLLG